METTDERHGVEEDTVRRSVRVVVVGDAGCGKTSLIYTYTRSQFYSMVRRFRLFCLMSLGFRGCSQGAAGDKAAIASLPAVPRDDSH